MAERVEVENVVVGAGVIGLAVAASLAQKDRDVFVLEAGPRIGCGISSRNSEVIHSGIYYETDSLKHRLCVEGRRLLYAYCDNRHIAYRKCGKLVVAADDREAEKLAAIARRAEANGIENVEIIDAAAAKRLEPMLHAVLALRVEETGIVDAHGLMLSLVGDVEAGGGAVLLDHRVVRGRRTASGRFELDIATANGRLTVSTRALVLAAGPWTHAVAAVIDGFALEDAPPLFLAKGSYFAHSGAPRFSRLIYPVPAQGGLGVHLTLDLAGQMRFGPDVEWLASNDPDLVDFSVDPARADAFYACVRRYWPDIADGALRPAYAGVRPKLSGPGAAAADFSLQGPSRHGQPGLAVLYGVESPGLTSSLAIGARVANMLET